MDADAFLRVGRAMGAAFAEPTEKFERRISRAKTKEYPRRSAEAWTKCDFHSMGSVEKLRKEVVDAMPRIDASLVSEAQFAETYERGSQPVLVRGLVDEWPAVRDERWTLEKLLQEHGQDRFKVGEDDDGYAVYVKLKHFVRYALETKDDSPLYVFDSSFAERDATRALRHDWTLPKFVTDD